LTAVEDQLVFVLRREDGGELWVSDEPGSARRIPLLDEEGAMVRGFFDSWRVVSGDLVYFRTEEPAHGAELWAFPRRDLEPFCAGDCDGDGVVEIAELVAGVAIEMERVGLEQCENADADLDDGVAVAELVRAVANALEGCR
jgi:hypothetical protein